MNLRPYPNGLGELGSSSGANDGHGAAFCVESIIKNANNCDENTVPNKKRKYKCRMPNNMVQDKSYLPDAERDELHIEIYNYLSWLHAKLVEVAKKAAESEKIAELLQVENKAAVAVSMSVDSTNDDSPSVDIPIEVKVEGEGEGDHEDKKQSATVKERPKKGNGVDVSELQCVLDKLESTFTIIPNVKLETAAEEMITLQQPPQGDQGQQVKIEAGEDQPLQQQQQLKLEPPQASAAAQASLTTTGAPFLEEALSKALSQLVAARELAGKPKRRSRKRKRQLSGNPNRAHSRAAGDFDEIFQRLVQYKEEHGNCSVPRSYEDQKLGNWVNGIRDKRSNLIKKGIEFEEIAPGKKILSKSLTAERLERLNAIGFVWSVAGPKVAWEDRFRDCREFYEMNGKWPSQSMGSLGEWVHKQRTLYGRKEASYMKNKAPKLDEIGFEWTPRGNTKMTWDEGFDMLVSVMNKLIESSHHQDYHSCCIVLTLRYAPSISFVWTTLFLSIDGVQQNKWAL